MACQPLQTSALTRARRVSLGTARSIHPWWLRRHQVTTNKSFRRPQSTSHCSLAPIWTANHEPPNQVHRQPILLLSRRSQFLRSGSHHEHILTRRRRCESRAVLIAPHSPPIIGLEDIRSAYVQLFANIEHMVDIKIEHFTLISDSAWAFIRTRCMGKCRVRATGAELEDDVQGSWILRHFPTSSELYQDRC